MGELLPTPSSFPCPPSLTLDSWGATSSVSSCCPAVIKRAHSPAPYTPFPCTHPLLRTPPTESPLCPPHNSKSVLGQPWPQRKPLLLEKTSYSLESQPSLEQSLEHVRNLPAAKWEGPLGPGWPSAAEGDGHRKKYSGHRQLRLGARAPFLREGLLAVHSALTGGLWPPMVSQLAQNFQNMAGIFFLCPVLSHGAQTLSRN